MSTSQCQTDGSKRNRSQVITRLTRHDQCLVVPINGSPPLATHTKYIPVIWTRHIHIERARRARKLYLCMDSISCNDLMGGYAVSKLKVCVVKLDFTIVMTIHNSPLVMESSYLGEPCHCVFLYRCVYVCVCGCVCNYCKCCAP